MGDEMSHVLELAERIGPRPATTDTEAEAADYIQGLFEARGLEVERQEFDTPRTYGWAYAAYHLLSLGCAVASGAAVLSPPVGWLAFVIAVAVAVVLRFDLDTRFGLTSVMPKGPSQNVIARHVPRVGRNERARRVVVVAHYDSAKSSLAFSPGMVRNFAVTFALMKWITYLLPLLILFAIVPWTAGWQPWTWYATLFFSAYLLVPLFINVQRELFGKPVAGANDNASGVAVMLALMERIVPEPEASGITGTLPKVEAASEAVTGSGVTATDEASPLIAAGGPQALSTWAGPADWADDEDTWSESRPADSQAAIDVTYTQPTAEQSVELFGVAPSAPAPVPAEAPAGEAPEAAAPAPAAPAAGTADDWGASWDDDTPAPSAGGPAPGSVQPLIDDVDADDLFGEGAPGAGADDAPAPPRAEMGEPIPEDRGGGGLFGRRSQGGEQRRGVSSWLGVSSDFDPKREGETLGTWETLAAGDEAADEDDDIGWKGGAAAIEDMDDPGFAASAAARIRRQVTSATDRELSEKEVWFVATGAEEVGTVGMRALIRDYGTELEDSFIINVDNVGSGTVVYVTSEGMAAHYQSDRRIQSAAKRAIREAELSVRGQAYRGLSTDATPALARGFRAMSVMAFDINGRLPDWHWHTDVPENCSADTMRSATDFVAELIKEL